MKKIIACILSLFVSVSIFAEDWFICLGSYKDENNANQRLEQLKENNVEASILKYTDDEDQTTYKIVINEIYEAKVDAIVRREEIKKLEGVKALGISDVWCWLKEETKIEKTARLAEEARLIELGREYELQLQSQGVENILTVEDEQPVENARTTPVSVYREPEVLNTAPVREPETYENRYIYITDSDTGLPVDNALVNIDETWERWTDYEGKASLPAEITDGEHTMVVSRGDEYVPTSGSFSIESGEVTTVPQLAIPRAVDFDRVKIVLNWGEYPSDLDSHVFTQGYHVYFANQDGGGINLDHDDTTSYGPETVTIREPDPTRKYEYYIHNYSDKYDRYSSRLSNSEAQINVYINNDYVKTYRVRPNQQGIAWHVFDIVNGNEIIDVDTVVTEDNHF